MKRIGGMTGQNPHNRQKFWIKPAQTLGKPPKMIVSWQAGILPKIPKFQII